MYVCPGECIQSQSRYGSCLIVCVYICRYIVLCSNGSQDSLNQALWTAADSTYELEGMRINIVNNDDDEFKYNLSKRRKEEEEERRKEEKKGHAESIQKEDY